MSIESPRDLAGLQAAGRAVAATLKEVRRLVRPGVTTAEHTIVITSGPPLVVTA